VVLEHLIRLRFQVSNIYCQLSAVVINDILLDFIIGILVLYRVEITFYRGKCLGFAC